MENLSEIRELPSSFAGRGEVKGYRFIMEVISDAGYVYSQRCSDTGRVAAFEVFRRKVNAQFGCVSYPRSKSFGKWAWSCGTLKEAVQKLEGF